MKEYKVFYHKKGQKLTSFNNMSININAKNKNVAMTKAKNKLGKNWTIEKINLR